MQFLQTLDGLGDEGSRTGHAVMLVATTDRYFEPQVAFGDTVIAVVLASVTLESAIDGQWQR